MLIKQEGFSMNKAQTVPLVSCGTSRQVRVRFHSSRHSSLRPRPKA